MSKKLSMDQLNELIECFKSVKDPRVQGRSRHLLIDVLVISVCAFLCGAEGINDIELFGNSKQSWLRKYLDLPYGIPSYDTIARILSIIDSEEMENAFYKWVESIKPSDVINKSISIDGKVSAGTKTGGSQNVLRMVSAYSHEFGLSLIEKDASEEGEVQATLECLELLDLKDVLVLADAGIGSGKVAAKIIEKEGDYIVPLKGNQFIYRDEVFAALSLQTGKRAITEEDQKGRGERRECVLLPAKNMTEKFYSQWPEAKSIFSITRERTEVDKRLSIPTTGGETKQKYKKNKNAFKYTEEITFYVSSRKLSPKEALLETRKHWLMENKLHWVLDVAFREDNCGVRATKLARTLSLTRKIALNIIRRSNTQGSVRGRMKRAAWEDGFLEKLLFI